MREAATVVAASTLATLVMWLVDVASWPSVRRPASFLVSLGLAAAIGAGTGLALLMIWLPLRAYPRMRKVLAFVVATAMVSLASVQAFASIPGNAPLVLVAAVLAVILLTYGLMGLGDSFAALGAFGLALIVLDRTILSSVFEKSYSFVEGTAHLALALAIMSVLRRSRRTTLMLAGAASVWLLVFAGSRAVRSMIERTLPAVWEEPVFAARWIRRVRRFDAGENAASRSLREKYALHHETDDDPWSAVVSPPEPTPSNVVVFFVDTLRADVAHDETVMPETVAWMRQNQWFSRGYATGSSTLLTLAPMLGCRYDTTPAQEPALLSAARSAGMRSALVIPKAASDYHHEQFPGFQFDHEDVLPDGGPERIPTANDVVDHALDWLRKEKPERFFLWAYQFDVHGWTDLDTHYVEGHGFSKDDGLESRYRATARGIDHAFARLRRGLDTLGLTQNTTIVFVSDHGEALGQQNFWAHSTYLWESLVRVPMAIGVPGKPPQVIDEPVSTIDLAPTLARFIGSPSHFERCHGEDLLAQTGERRLPILFSAMIDGELSRIGMLGAPDRKLVVDLRNADARLLRIREGSSVEEDISILDPASFSLHLRRLSRAPTFPR